MALQDILDAEQEGTIDPVKKAALEEARKRNLPSVQPPKAQEPAAPEQPEPSTFQKVATGAKNLVTTKEGAKTLGRTVADVAVPMVADIAMAPVAALSGPAAPAVEIGTNMAASEAVQVGANLLSGRKWNEGVGETALFAGAAGTLAKAVSSTVKAISTGSKNTEVAFTKIYGALKDSAKGQFEKLKKLPYFNAEEKKAILEIPPGVKRDAKLVSLLDAHDNYQELLKRGGNSKSQYDASTFFGEKVQAKEVGNELKLAEARLNEIPNPDAMTEAKEDIHNLNRKIFEENKGTLNAANIRGINDYVDKILTKYEPDQYKKAPPEFQIFSQIKSALNSDIDNSGAKFLRMGNKLYAREKDLDKIFNEGFETGKVVDVKEAASRTGLRNFSGEKFANAIRDSKMLSQVEKDKLMGDFGSRLKGFELPTEGDFASIRTAEAALSRHLAMKAALGGLGVGAAIGGAAGAQRGEGAEGAGFGGLALAGAGLLTAKGLSRTKMVGNIVKMATNIPGGPEAIKKELVLNNGKLTRKSILALANLGISYYKNVGDEQIEQGNQYKEHVSKQIINKTQELNPELGK